MSVLSAIANDFNIAETWVKDVATKVQAIVAKEKALAPAAATAIAGTYSKLQAFLAAATPAVAGEGLNFPVDSVAYSAFVALVQQFQSDAAVIEEAVKEL